MTGKRGPKPKPTAIRILEGNPSRRPLNELEPACDMPAVKPSVVAMDECASQEWDRLLAAMPPGLYTAMDVGVLTTYALAYSMLVKAQADIDANGVLITLAELNKEGRTVIYSHEVNPAVKIWKTASETLLKTADRLGLHPGARSRLQIPGRKEQPQQSRFAGLLGSEANE